MGARHHPLLPVDGPRASGEKVGFVGFGAISHAVAKILDGFECDISFYDPFIPESQGHYKKTSLEELFAQSDIITLHLPVTEDTRGMITESLLRSMKKTALFVNAARSALVDYKALAAVLNEKAIGGAIIDVLDEMSIRFEDIDDNLVDLEDGLDAVSDDLSEVEEALYEMDDEDDEELDDDAEYFETTCPVCQEEIVFDEDTLDSGEIRCPNCGEKLEFDLSDLADSDEDDED